jgi:hypothetical protein
MRARLLAASLVLGAPFGCAPSRPPATPAAPPAAGAFRHPGVVVTRASLEFVKARIRAGEEPWTSALAKTAERFGALAYRAEPFAVVECGPYSKPSVGCMEERNDALAAYTHALRWYFTGDVAHARKAIEIMNAWSAVLKDHANSNERLQAAWVGALWPRAAEIIRHTYDGWAPGEVERFRVLLRDVYLPEIAVSAGGTNGNWELTMADAMLGIAVFLDDRATFDHALARWRKRVPAYIYMEADGPRPIPPPDAGKDEPAALKKYWYGQERLADGVGQETCRDLAHLAYGLASIAHAAETARIQGVDLYEEESARIRAGLERHAAYLNGEPVPEWLCGGKLDLGDYKSLVTWEIALNHYEKRKGLALPQTRRLVEKIRPTGTYLHMAWETLTHAESGENR